MKKSILFISSFLIFSFLYNLGNYFFWVQKTENILEKQIEYKYIEPIVENKEQEEQIEQAIIKQKVQKKQKLEEKELISKPKQKIFLYYTPEELSKNIKEHTKILNNFLKSEIIDNKYEELEVFLYKNKIDRRWKMKDKSIHLFGIQEMVIWEFLAVWIHELAHYIDLYTLRKSLFTDVSNYFYEISWDATNIMKSGQYKRDFVSWYSMTNKYEDFAESFTYYVLHNKDFLEKTKKSKKLKEKYNYFSKYVFKNEEFKNSDFSINNIIEDYYRDTTTIVYDRKKIIDYLKNFWQKL